jgi:regulator of nucleoside diphosphate kinase
MEEREIYITEYDRQRLMEVMRESVHAGLSEKKYFNDLRRELERARVVAPREVPSDVITMNSRVRLRDLDSGEDETYTLVFPEDADLAHNRLSVLAPVGTALIGYRVGDVIEWPVPDGVRRLRIEAIEYQPESSGDYHL